MLRSVVLDRSGVTLYNKSANEVDRNDDYLYSLRV